MCELQQRSSEACSWLTCQHGCCSGKKGGRNPPHPTPPHTTPIISVIRSTLDPGSSSKSGLCRCVRLKTRLRQRLPCLHGFKGASASADVASPRNPPPRGTLKPASDAIYCDRSNHLRRSNTSDYRKQNQRLFLEIWSWEKKKRYMYTYKYEI